MMILRTLAFLFVASAALLAPPLAAQALRAPVAAGAAVRPGGGAGIGTGNFIVAVVNSEPITNVQVQVEVERIRQQLTAQRRPLPATQEIARQVLNQLINERVQLQLARDTGIKVDEPSIDQAEQTVASQNQLTLEQLGHQLEREGIDHKKFRERLREQLLITRLRERDVESRVRVSDLEVDQYLNEQLTGGGNAAEQRIHLAHILVAVPDGAAEQQVAELQGKAERLLQRARGGEDFATLARETSDAPDRANGGDLGLRSAERYPSLFVEAVRALAPGGVAGPVRSGAGFHIIRLLERQQPGLPPATVTQSRARHILLVPSSQMTEAYAIERIKDFKRRIQSGQTDFATLARQSSQDSSAAQGGDLGWANPGMFVPEFERVMDSLAPGQISDPVISRFGVHLIQLMERRSAKLSEREQREMVRNMLRDKKFGEAHALWMQEVRAKAYVELREAPQ